MTVIKPIRFGANPPQVESSRPAEVVSGDPATSTQNYFTDPTGQFSCGVWSSTPGKWKVRYAEAEFVMLLSGKVVLEAADGTCESFSPGDIFVIPAGFEGSWETVETCRKLYAIYEQPSPEPLKRGDRYDMR